MRVNRWWLLGLVAAFLLVGASSASAATCTYSASGNWTTGGSCGSTPASSDTAVINSGVNVTVDADHTIAGITMNGGTITFSGSNPTLTDSGAFASNGNDTLTGNGTLTVAGTETHPTASSTLTVTSAADLVLNSTGGIDGGAICLFDNAGGDPTDDPSLQIGGTFTIGPSADSVPFGCNSGLDTAALQVGATGTLVDGRSGTTSIGTPMQVAQGGLVHVTTGILAITGGSATGVDNGEWTVDSGRTLQLSGSSQPNDFGSHTAIDGAGTLEVLNTEAIPLGATFTISNLKLEGALTLNDNATTYTPDTLALAGGTLLGDRDVTPGSLDDSAGGGFGGTFTITIGSSTPFTVSAQLSVTDGAHFILNKDFTAGLGADICLLGDGAGPEPDPVFEIDRTFTIAATASSDQFACNSGVQGPGLEVASTGTLVNDRTGTTSITTPMGNAGTVHVASGQTLALTSGYEQTGGTTTIDAGGVMTGNSGTVKNVSGGTMTVNGTVGPRVDMTGGVLNGTGTVNGDLNNNGGSVRPGSSPGIMTVSGNYSQGPGGTLGVDIDGTTPGTQYDQLQVGGSATLAGTLAIATGGGFNPALTDTFDVLTASGTVSGAFTTLTGAQLSGKHYVAQYTGGPPGKATLALAPDSTGTPPPPPAPPPAPPSVAPPVNLGAPTIPPTALPGDVVKCNPGTWTDTPTFSYQWLRDGAAIAGAVSQFYAVAPGDVGHQITCQVTATNAGGSTRALSNVLTPQSPPVTIAGLPAAQGCVPGGLSLGVGVRSAGLKSVTSFIDGKRVSVSTKAHFRLNVPKGRIGAGRHLLRILASYRTGTLNKRFSFVKCRGGGRSPAIRIGGAPSRTVCRSTAFTFHALIAGALPSSVALTLDGRPLAKPGKLNFFRTIDVAPLAPGPHEALVITTDRFGNKSRDAIDFLRC